jgi:uncharacterized membrane protein YedE/YeeE
MSVSTSTAAVRTAPAIDAVIPFVAGLLFAIGLGLSGMTQPEKVIGFLDVTGRWDASLALVMGGAVVLGALGFAPTLRAGRPLFARQLHLPSASRVDGKLIAGAAVFGVGWGLSGYCPAPALMSVVTLNPGTLVFVSTMMLGLLIAPRAWLW